MHAYGTVSALLVAVAAIGASGRAHAQEQQDETAFYDANGLRMWWHLQLGLNAVSERNLFWNFAATLAPQAGFDPDADWLETYIKPGLSFEQRLNGQSIFYGTLSGVGSYTAGIDAFDWGNTGRITLEEAYLGYRTEGSGPNVDLSLGARELKLGSGMLIANGGSSGFERGALKFGPRKAWKRAAIAMVSLMVMGTSQILNSTVLKNGCTRRSHQIFFALSIQFVLTSSLMKLS